MWVLLGVLGCGWWNDERALRAELDAARQEIAALRADLDALAGAPPGGAVEIVAYREPAPELANHEPAQRLDVEALADLEGAVDDALDVLEADVDQQARALKTLEASMREVSAILNNHADLIDVLGGEIEVVDEQLGLLRALDGTLEVEDGQIRIVDADLVLVPGLDEAGRVKSNGQIRTGDPAVADE